MGKGRLRAVVVVRHAVMQGHHIVRDTRLIVVAGTPIIGSSQRLETERNITVVFCKLMGNTIHPDNHCCKL